MYDVANFKTTIVWTVHSVYYICLTLIRTWKNFIDQFRTYGFIFNFKDPIHLYNLNVSTIYSIAILQKTSKVIINVFDYIFKVIVIVIITFLQVL